MVHPDPASVDIGDGPLERVVAEQDGQEESRAVVAVERAYRSEAPETLLRVHAGHVTHQMDLDVVAQEVVELHGLATRRPDCSEIRVVVLVAVLVCHGPAAGTFREVRLDLQVAADPLLGGLLEAIRVDAGGVDPLAVDQDDLAELLIGTEQ